MNCSSRRALPAVMAGLAALAPSPRLRAAESPTSFEGVWRTVGYGYLLDIQGDRIRLLETSSQACVPSAKGRIRDGRISLDAGPFGTLEGRIAREGEDLIVVFNGTERRRAHRLPALPPEARTRMMEGSKDPLVVFDAMWQAFEEQYAFFALRKVDWRGRREAFRARAGAARGEEALFEVLKDLLAPLGDGHVTLLAGVRDKWQWRCGTLPSWFGEVQAFTSALKTRYLVGPAELRANRKVVFGRLGNGAGYLALMSMDHLGEDFSAAGEALDRALDEAFASLAGAPALVLDLRFNGGGQDAHALRAASRFASEGHLVCTKQARDGAGWTEPEAFRLEPSARSRWVKPVYLLTSRLTASAAETCTLALCTQPHVVHLGERTAGIFSDMLPRRLPNGWVVTLSNERYLDASGHCPEGEGIPPAQAVPMDLEAARIGLDPMLERAFTLMKAAGTSPGAPSPAGGAVSGSLP